MLACLLLHFAQRVDFDPILVDEALGPVGEGEQRIPTRRTF